MEAEKPYQGLRLPVVCAEREDELGLSRSGHPFCTNRLCKDEFDVRGGLAIYAATKFLTEQQKLQ